MTVHIAGAGLAGLAAALAAARAGHEVMVHEAAGLAGGRCRSFFDPALGRVIDNGTHVILGANGAALAFLDLIGAPEAMIQGAHRALPFVDLDSGTTWSVDVTGHAVGSLLSAAPGIVARARLVLAHLAARTGPEATAAALYGNLGEVYERLIVPLCTAVMNRPTEETPASQFTRLIGGLGAAGRGALRPYLARENLAAAFVHPALRTIEQHGGKIRFHDPLTEIEISGSAARTAVFRSGPALLGPRDALVLALPPWSLDDLLPRDGSGTLPRHRSRAILCAHFAIAPPVEAAGATRLTGCINGNAQWIAVSEGLLSVTVSAADHWMPHRADDIAARLWRDAAAVFDLPVTPIPDYRVIKERRATADVSGGFGPTCEIDKIFFAGGWTSAQYPDTIEAAVASGVGVARCLDPPG